MGMYTPLVLLILQVLNNLSVKQEDGELGGSTVEVLLGGGTAAGMTDHRLRLNRERRESCNRFVV